MISLNKRIEAFAAIGKQLKEVGECTSEDSCQNNLQKKLENAVVASRNYNGWFVVENVRHMLASIGESLSKPNIEKWVEPYLQALLQDKKSKTIGVVMAGNVPLVGFHDFLSILISGNSVIAKLSSDDNKLLPIIAEMLVGIEPAFEKMIEFTSTQLSNFDAIIATGSNNTSRYFEYYFGKYPNIIRKNRNSIALLTGDESDEELQNLSKDIFMYYGLGCRNVSHIMLPEGYDMTNLLRILSLNEEITINHKYFNNYEYNKAIYLVNSTIHFDTGNLLLTEDARYSSPVSVIHFSYYNDVKLASRMLITKNSEIQCVVTKSDLIKDAVPFGFSQSPQLWDYADGTDTIRFLSNL